jgi:curved DNA-binding protein CbpA
MSSHNLDINKYSLEEIFGLFDLTYNLTEDSMRAAKKKVLMIHPDKSRLPPEYFHFYREAYEIVLNIYKQKARQTEGALNGNPVYKPLDHEESRPDISKKMAESVLSNAGTSVSGTSNAGTSKNQNAFNNKFNDLYDKNMVRKADTSRYDWFRQADSVFDDFSQKQVNPKNMGTELEAIKQKQAALQVYRGVQEMNASGSRGTSYFEEDDGADYVSSDVFSKLKFDDLRKVHKDQTVFAVSESDLNKRVQYKSVDQFVRDRDGGNQAPLSKMEASQLLERQQKEKEQLIMNKQHRDFMLQKEYEAKQQAVRAAFLQLK